MLVCARISGIAIARFADGIAREFQRRKPGNVPDMLSDHLIDRNASVNIGAGRFLDANACQKCAIGPRVVAGSISSGSRIDMVKPGENLDPVLNGFERLERLAETEIPAFTFGPPSILNRAVWEVHEGHAQRCAAG